MSDPKYVITHENLVELLAAVCAHGILGERDDEAAEAALARSDELLARTGVRDVTEINEEIGLALAELLPDEVFPEATEGDPYEWESGT